jgi:hypothetical protein
MDTVAPHVGKQPASQLANARMDESMNMHVVFIKCNVTLYVVAHDGQLSCTKNPQEQHRKKITPNPIRPHVFTAFGVSSSVQHPRRRHTLDNRRGVREGDSIAACDGVTAVCCSLCCPSVASAVHDERSPLVQTGVTCFSTTGDS